MSGLGLLFSGCTPFARQKVASLPDLALVYAMPRDGAETAWLARYTARGKPLGPHRRLGPLGLIAEYQIISGAGPLLAVTTGKTLWLFPRSQGAVRQIPAPPQRTILSVRWMERTLYAVIEDAATRQVDVNRLAGGRWVEVLGLPRGLTALWPSTAWGPAVSVMGPRSVQWFSLKGPSHSPRVVGIRPQGSVGFTARAALIPFTAATNQFGVVHLGLDGGSRLVSPSPRLAPLQVTDTRPLWAATVLGMEPYAKSTGTFNPKRLVPWPGRMSTTIRLVGSGPWVLALDGSARGYWFDVKTGRFGPRFGLTPPPGGIARGVAPVPRR